MHCLPSCISMLTTEYTVQSTQASETLLLQLHRSPHCYLSFKTTKNVCSVEKLFVSSTELNHDLLLGVVQSVGPQWHEWSHLQQEYPIATAAVYSPSYRSVKTHQTYWKQTKVHRLRQVETFAALTDVNQHEIIQINQFLLWTLCLQNSLITLQQNVAGRLLETAFPYKCFLAPEPCK